MEPWTYPKMSEPQSYTSNIDSTHHDRKNVPEHREAQALNLFEAHLDITFHSLQGCQRLGQPLCYFSVCINRSIVACGTDLQTGSQRRWCRGIGTSNWHLVRCEQGAYFRVSESYMYRSEMAAQVVPMRLAVQGPASLVVRRRPCFQVNLLFLCG